MSIYHDFGFDEVAVKLATRPAQRLGSDVDWDLAEQDLEEAVKAAGLPYTLNPGEGCILRPKARIRAA